MRGALFRQEALDHQRPALVGSVLSTRPLSFRLIAIAAVALATCVVLFACFATYTQRARVAGYLAPTTGLIKVYVPIAGTLTEKYVSEGQQVKRGDTLFALSTERASTKTSETQAAAIRQLRERLAHLDDERKAQQRIDVAQAQIRRERVQSTTTELLQLEAQLGVQRERARTAEKAAARYSELFSRGLITRLQVEESEASMLEQRSRSHELERAHTALRRDLTTLQRELAAAELEAEKRVSELDRQVLTLQQELTEAESRRVVLITAPADGTVTAITGERGLTATPQAPLLALLPRDARLQARLLVPSRAIGAIAVGDEVRVRYHAFPYQRYGTFSGHVTEISKTLLAPNELDGPVTASEPVYRITVGLARQNVGAGTTVLPLQAGMQLEADVLLARRRLIEWMFEPLMGAVRKS